MIIDVVVRCRNEMPFTARTLDGLARQQGATARVLFVDNGSTDGSLEAARERGAQVLEVAPGAYVPGRVVNDALGRTTSPIVALINADCVPADDRALERLIAPLVEDPELAAAYARQLPRPDASAAVKSEYARAFPDGEPLGVRHGAFFSLAASAIRRDVWSAMPFDEDLRYSEDVDWSHRARLLGWGLRYVPDAMFEHSHDYTLAQHFRRRLGEGVADTAIFGLGTPSPAGELVRPLVGALGRDARARVLTPSALAVRVAQAAGYFVGRTRSARRS